jgi:hypothetical protein
MNSLLPHTLCALGVTVTAAAQTFTYPTFASTAGLALLGNAVQNGAVLRLTANASSQSGWAWRQVPVAAIAGFDTTFTFRITPPGSGGGNQGEGLAFVIHADPAGAGAQGGTAWGLGYGSGASASSGIASSLVLEYDTSQDAVFADSSANELSLHTRGSQGNHEHEQWSLGRTTPSANLADGQVHSLRVRYANGGIAVFVDGSPSPALSRAYDLVAGGAYANNAPAPGVDLANGTAWVGFAATTRAGIQTQSCELLSWSWTSAPLAHPCYLGTLGQDTLRVAGSAGGPLREVRLVTHQSFAIDVAPPPAVGPGAPYVLFLSLLPQPGALGTQLGFGETCFPVLPAGASELVLADTFGLFPAVLPALPAPHTFAIPAAVVVAPLAFTLQAVTLASSSPLALGVTNAIDVTFVPSGPPAITSVSPLSAAPGQPIAVHGQRFVPGFVLTVNGAPVAPTSSSATQIVFPFPAGLACGSQLTVTNPDNQAATSPLNPQPSITSTGLGSGSAAGGQLFQVNGSGFAPGTTVTIGGAPATVVEHGPLFVLMWTPPGTPGVAPVIVTTPGGCVATTTYTYL